MIPTLVGVAVLTFVVMRLVPGDIVALRYAGASVPQEVIDRERALLGLDKPMWAQFLDWMGQLARLDLGSSLWTGHTIVDEVWTRLPLSLELAVIATALAVVFALPLGVLAAVRQDSWVDYAIRIFSVGGLAMPSFWIGIMLVLTTITLWGWAPPFVFTPLFQDPIATGRAGLAVRQAVQLGRDARRQAARDADRDRTFGLGLRHAVSDYRMRRVAGLKLG